MQKEIRSINQQLGGLAHAVFLTALGLFLTSLKHTKYLSLTIVTHNVRLPRAGN